MTEASDEVQFPIHHDGKRFYNPGAPPPRGLLDVFRWKLTSRAEPSPQFVFDTAESVPPQRDVGSELRVTLINHSTALLQQRSSNILTDPIWSDRASPFSWIGPRRHRKPGVRLEDLPPIDLVLLSHNHYDHMDVATLRWLAKHKGCSFIVPLGLARSLRSANIGPVHECDWGNTQIHGSTAIHAVPAIHFSGRGLFDRNKTLWCGFVIRSDNRSVYFAADTAFGDHFSDIRKKFGPPDLSLLPIGAYKPRWFMSAVHMAPEDAVRAHEILGSRMSVATHHGTFQLADDALDTAKKDLATLLQSDSFVVLENGQSLVIP